MLRVASRDMRGDQWSNKWPALLDYTIDTVCAPLFLNNMTVDKLFIDTNDIYEFIKLQNSTNVMPDQHYNSLYTIYRENDTGWEPHYSLRPKLFHEANINYLNDKGVRDILPYVHVEIPRIIIDPQIIYSTPMIRLNTKKYMSYFEGIFPLTINSRQDKYYMNEYVQPISKFIDTAQTEIKLVKYNPNKKPSWLPGFLEKLVLIQVELEKISYNNGFFDQPTDYFKMIDQLKKSYAIYNTFQENGKITFPMNGDLNASIKQILFIPIFYDGSLYQIKYNEKIITWHKLYQYMIDKNNWVPSKDFFDMVSNVNIFTWSLQYAEYAVVYQALEELVKVCENNQIVEKNYIVGDRVTSF